MQKLDPLQKKFIGMIVLIAVGFLIYLVASKDNGESGADGVDHSIIKRCKGTKISQKCGTGTICHEPCEPHLKYSCESTSCECPIEGQIICGVSKQCCDEKTCNNGTCCPSEKQLKDGTCCENDEIVSDDKCVKVCGNGACGSHQHCMTVEKLNQDQQNFLRNESTKKGTFRGMTKSGTGMSFCADITSDCMWDSGTYHNTLPIAVDDMEPMYNMYDKLLEGKNMCVANKPQYQNSVPIKNVLKIISNNVLMTPIVRLSIWSTSSVRTQI
jgi:hypothetical protein